MMLVVLVITLIYVFTVYIRLKEFLLLFYITGGAYLLAGFLETYSYKSLGKKGHSYIYTTDSAAAKSLIKIMLFLAVGITLYISGSIIKYMAFMCFLRSGLELVNVFYKRISRSMFVCLESDTITIATNKPEIVYAHELQQINYRHGLLYLVKTDRKTITIRADVMPEKDAFVLQMQDWATANKIAVVNEP